MVPLEGMAAGVPIVASRIPGFEFTVEHGVQGLLVDDFLDPDAFAESLLALLDQPEMRARMGAEGRRRALQVYSLDVVTRQYENLYEELLARPPTMQRSASAVETIHDPVGVAS
jgi:glycosyltransferase involved in cell wall biosynthesis